MARWSTALSHFWRMSWRTITVKPGTLRNADPQSLSHEQPLIPPNRRFGSRLQPGKLGMTRVDDDVALRSGDDGRYDQDAAAPLGIPLMAEPAGRWTVPKMPVRQGIRANGFVGRACGYPDLDEVRVSGWRPVPIDQRFQHRGRVVFRSVDDPVANVVPPSGDLPGSVRAEYVPSALRISDSPGPSGRFQPRRTGQTATPAWARRTRLSTASAPAEDEIAISSGASPSSRGCGRLRKSSIRATSP